MTSVLVPIFCGVVLPVSIVLIISIAKSNDSNRRAEILKKAIEAGWGPDTEKLVEAMHKPQSTPREILTKRLLRGCIYTLIGCALIIFSIVACFNDASLTESDSASLPAIGGSISLAIGISYLIVYAITRRDIIENN